MILLPPDGRRHARRVSAEGSRRAGERACGRARTRTRALVVPTLVLVNPYIKLGDTSRIYIYSVFAYMCGTVNSSFS